MKTTFRKTIMKITNVSWLKLNIQLFQCNFSSIRGSCDYIGFLYCQL